MNSLKLNAKKKKKKKQQAATFEVRVQIKNVKADVMHYVI